MATEVAITMPIISKEIRNSIVYCVNSILVKILLANIRLQRKYVQVLGFEKMFVKLYQNWDLNVFLCVEFEYVAHVRLSLVHEADARFWYPLNLMIVFFSACHQD